MEIATLTTWTLRDLLCRTWCTYSSEISLLYDTGVP